MISFSLYLFYISVSLSSLILVADFRNLLQNEAINYKVVSGDTKALQISPEQDEAGPQVPGEGRGGGGGAGPGGGGGHVARLQPDPGGGQGAGEHGEEGDQRERHGEPDQRQGEDDPHRPGGEHRLRYTGTQSIQHREGVVTV